jgi:hypothetical protein
MKLVRKIAAWLAGEAREIGVVRPLTLRAVTGSAGQNMRRHRVWRLLGGSRKSRAWSKQAEAEQSGGKPAPYHSPRRHPKVVALWTVPWSVVFDRGKSNATRNRSSPQELRQTLCGSTRNRRPSCSFTTAPRSRPLPKRLYGGDEGTGANGRIWPAKMSAELPEGWAWAS